MQFGLRNSVVGILCLGVVLLLVALVVKNNEATDGDRELERGLEETSLDPTDNLARRNDGADARTAAIDGRQSVKDGDVPPDGRTLLQPAIRGYVTDARGVAIEDARVSLLHIGNLGGGGESFAVLDRRRSDRQGAFEFSGAFECARMGLRIHHSDYALQERLGIVASADPRDACRVELLRGLDLKVTVVRENGYLVSGAEVVVSPLQSVGQSFCSDIEQAALTGEDGVAVIRNLGVGRKLVVLKASGLCARGTMVQISGTQENEVRLVTSEGRRIRGRVVTSEGAAVGGALVIAQTPQSPGVLRRDIYGSVVTDSDGVFLCYGPPAGFLSLNVELAGYAPAISRATLVRPQDDSVEIVMSQCEQRRVEVVCRGNDHAPNQMLLLMTRTPSIRGPQLRSAQLIDGRQRTHPFSVPPPVRSFFLHILADGFAPASSSIARAGEQESVVIELGRGALLSGSVVDPEGKPVVGAAVALHRAQIGRALNLLGAGRQAMPISETRTDDLGVYRFEQVPIGSWRRF